METSTMFVLVCPSNTYMHITAVPSESNPLYCYYCMDNRLSQQRTTSLLNPYYVFKVLLFRYYYVATYNKVYQSDHFTA